MGKKIMLLCIGLLTSFLLFGQEKPRCSTEITKTFDFSDAKKINQMSLEELQCISESKQIDKEWLLAQNKQIKNIYRGFFIDSLIRFKFKDTIQKLITMYGDETDETVKNKIITATMLYYQSHINLDEPSEDKTLLLRFYNQLLSEKLGLEATHDVMRSYIDLNTSQNILANIERINNQLSRVDTLSLVGLEIQLARKSIELEKIYIPSLISTLKKENQSQLDEMFFGMISLFYKQLQRFSINEIIAYMDSVSAKYLNLTSLNAEDPYFEIAAGNFKILRQEINAYINQPNQSLSYMTKKSVVPAQAGNHF